MRQSAREERKKAEELDRAAREEAEAELALQRAARGRNVMVDARSGLVAMRPLKQGPELDVHGAPVGTRLRGDEEDQSHSSHHGEDATAGLRQGSVGHEQQQQQQRLTPLPDPAAAGAGAGPGTGHGSSGTGTGTPSGRVSEQASWEDALDRPAPVARPAPKDLFHATDPVHEALGAARLDATKALADVQVRETKDEDEERDAYGGTLSGPGARARAGDLDLDAHVKQTGRFYGVEEQQQPLMLHTSALSPGVRAREGPLAAAGPPAPSPGRGRVTVSEYMQLAASAGEGGGTSGRGGVVESAAARAARHGRESREGTPRLAEGERRAGGADGVGVRQVSNDDLLEGGRSVEDARRELLERSQRGGDPGGFGAPRAPAGSPDTPARDRGSGGNHRKPGPPQRGASARSPARLRSRNSPGPAPIAAAGRRMSPQRREAALGRRPRDPRERVSKRAASSASGQHAPAPLYPATSRFDPAAAAPLGGGPSPAGDMALQSGGVQAPLSLQSASTGMGEADIYEGGMLPSGAVDQGLRQVGAGGSVRLDPAMAAIAAAEAAPEMRKVRRSAGLKQTEPAAGLGRAAATQTAGLPAISGTKPGSLG